MSNDKYVRQKHSHRWDEALEFDFQSWWKEHCKYETETEAFNAYALELIRIKKEQKSISLWLDKKGFSAKKPLEGNMPTIKETQKHDPIDFSESPCHFLVYVKKEPKCADQDAPIDSYLKRHLNGQICALCQELRNKKLEEVQKKQLEKAKKETHKVYKRLNQTLKQEDEFKGHPRVNYDTNPIPPPY